ncbi:MAG: peptidase, partial [Gemmatimonadetes bacterium]|nr:peptidase [Gemmatimonadota bacterium]
MFRKIILSVLLIVFAGPLSAQTRVTTPKEFLGFNFGDDYQLANYTQMSAYWRKLATESDRLLIREIGKTAEGRTQLMVIASSPANLKNLARYQEISRRLALAEGLTDDEARTLAKEGRSVVWIDGGLHASEVVGSQQLGEMVYQMASRTDEETMRILNDDIILFVHANPDGNELVADWYNRNPVPAKRGYEPGLPRLYHKYIGHDDNRDFFGSTQPETENDNRVMYTEWFPQIVYNHHQSGPAGTVMFAPPFRDPFNFNFAPLLVVQLDLVSAAMHSRFEAEGKPGVTMRTGATYSTWWNGGLRTTSYFHNMIGILTEIIGSPTPMQIPYVPRQVLPRADLPYPIEPQEWHFRQSIDYSVTANRAILDIASRNRENFLYNMYRMGKNSIERGQRDSWTMTPRRVAKANEEAAKRGGGATGAPGMPAASGFNGYTLLKTPELRDPRGYIIPSDQPDFPTATKFVNALLENGIAVHRATAAFPVTGKNYPAGSYVVLSAQAFRPHVLDMFEPQDHPDDFPYPGAPPTPPYDITGWTLAYQMGIKFDRILEGFTGPFEKITAWNLKPVPGAVASGKAAGYLTSHQVNDAFLATNRLLSASEDVYWLTQPMAVGAKSYPAGTLYVTAKGSTEPALRKLAAELGVSFDATAAAAPRDAWKLRKPRIAVMDVYGGSMTAGWTRWILEQFEFPYERVFVPQIDQGSLNGKYDVLILPNGVLRQPGRGGDDMEAAATDYPDSLLPPEYRNQRGRASAETTYPAIKRFVENGGTLITIGSSSPIIAKAFSLPVTDHLTENGQPLPRTKFFAPGSVLQADVDSTIPLAAGMPGKVDVFFDNSPEFDLAPDAASKGVRRVMWFSTSTPLRSGWAWGQSYLENGTAAVEANVGKGKAFLFGPEILQRAQPHGTFKFL